MESLEQRAKRVMISSATDYKSVFLDHDYLIYSRGFTVKPYYIISAQEGNYKHLTGVVSDLSPYEFYLRCLQGTITEADFGFDGTGMDVKSVKSIVKKKIKSLPYMTKMFNTPLMTEENFIRGRVSCALATSDSMITLGFEDRVVARPKTLLYGNLLKDAVGVDLVLRRKRGAQIFDTVMQGDVRILMTNYFEIRNQ